MGILPSEIKRQTFFKFQDVSDPRYGCKPSSRPISELIRLGVINLDKPRGPTSHEVSAWVKDILKVRKTGHGGTLDPGVSGVLPIAIEDATKITMALQPAGKEYVCLMVLHKNVPEDRLLEVLKEFTGEIFQRPPVRAAVKRRIRTRQIYYIEPIEIDGKNVLMRVGCEAGTYMRKLCHDIGEALGCGAHMQELRRTKTGPFKEENSVKLQDLADAYAFWKEDGSEEELRKVILPVESAVEHLPKILIRDGAVDALCHGASLAAPGVVAVDSDIVPGSLVAIMTLKGELVELAKAVMSTEQILEAEHGIVAKPERVVMRPGTYPREWRK